MKTITMLEFRQDAEAIIRSLQQGVRMVLTDHGKPVARLEPIEPDKPAEPSKSAESGKPEVSYASDPFFSMCELGEKWISTKDKSLLTNEEIDRIVYEYDH